MLCVTLCVMLDNMVIIIAIITSTIMVNPILSLWPLICIAFRVLFYFLSMALVRRVKAARLFKI